MGAVKEQKNVLLQPLDTTIELVSCGSSYSDMPSFGAWELTMLDECYDNIDYVSLHRYYANPTVDTPPAFSPAAWIWMTLSTPSYPSATPSRARSG